MLSSRNSQNQGIDVQKAFEILAARSTDCTHTQSAGRCGCGAGGRPPQGVENLGQIIELTTDGSSNNGSEPSSSKYAGDTASIRGQVAAADRAKRSSEIEQRLRSMSVKELLQYVLDTQQQRVLTYREYDKGLDDAIASGDITCYPLICASVTASFSVISDTINAVGKVLGAEPVGSLDLVMCIRQLQAFEKDKLSLTAALHLERIRERSQAISVGDENDQILLLLRASIRSLRSRIADQVVAINEVLEELRHVLLTT